jgi:activator of 2-hydroxyglutaryl-CoA dehydratase
MPAWYQPFRYFIPTMMMVKEPGTGRPRPEVPPCGVGGGGASSEAIANIWPVRLSNAIVRALFEGQELIKTLMNGELIENLIYALYLSVVRRVLEMTAVYTDIVAFSGGVVAHHPLLVELFGKKLENKTMVLAPETQFCGALGAALHGIPVR